MRAEVDPCASRIEPSRLMQNPLGAAFARKVLRCKARDEGRTLVLFDEARNAAAGHFSRKPSGAVLRGAASFVGNLAGKPGVSRWLPVAHLHPPGSASAPCGH